MTDSSGASGASGPTVVVVDPWPRSKRRREIGAVHIPGRKGKPDRRPTDLVDRSEKNGVTIGPMRGRHWHVPILLFLFFRYLVRVLFRRITGRYDPLQAAQEMRGIFERLGGLWVKFGQLLSLRSDVLSRPFCDELSHLQYRSIGFAPEEAVRIIEQELGGPIDEFFSYFDPVPHAAASVSQVHVGRLRRRDVDVVIKVLRPGVAEVMRRDLRLLSFLVRLLNLSSKVRRLKLGGALVELRQIMTEETDFRYEAENMRRLRRITKEDKVHIPKPYLKLSTRRVLVMERVFGVLMSDYIAATKTDPFRVHMWLQENDIDPKKVGKRLFFSFLHQLFEENLFHADLHPGNIILLRDSRVALIDLGSVGSIDKDFLAGYMAMVRALAANDFGKAADLQLRVCTNVPQQKLPQLRDELIRVYHLWAARTRITSLPYHERSVISGSNDSGRVLFRYGASQSWEFMKLGRTWATLDASMAYLYPDIDYVKVFRQYFVLSSRRFMQKNLSLAALRDRVGNAIGTAQEYHLMFSSIMRRNSLTLQSLASKAARVGGIVMKLMQFAAVFGFLVIVYSFVMHHYPQVGQAIRHDLLDDFLIYAPSLDHSSWLLIVAAALLVLVAIRRIQQELKNGD